MDKLHLYLSGPMSGYPDHNFPAFAEAREALRDRGHRVTCPAESGLTPSPEVTWSDYLRHDLRLLLDVEALAVLPGWELSRGARLEVDVAHRLGLPAYPVEQLLAWTPSLVDEVDPFERNRVVYRRELYPGEQTAVDAVRAEVAAVFGLHPRTGAPLAARAIFADEHDRFGTRRGVVVEPGHPSPAEVAAAAHRRRIRRASSS